MKFSIIVPVYNAINTLDRCIKSVIDQDYEDFEIIIIDDGSTDGSTIGLENKVTGLNAKIIRINNAGVSNARNIGMNNSSGEYLLYLDADDELPLRTLSIYESIITHHNYPDIVLAGFTKVYPSREEDICLWEENKVLHYDHCVKEFNPFFSRTIGCVWGKCYKRKLIESARFNKELSLCEDAEFNFSVFDKAESIIYSSKILYRYYYTRNSTIRVYNPEYIEKYVESLELIYSEVEKEKIVKNAYEFGATVLNVICFNVIFTENNTESTIGKIDTVKEICEKPVFCRTLKNIDLSMLSKKQRITIFFLKNKLYMIMPIFGVINRTINKRLYKEVK